MESILRFVLCFIFMLCCVSCNTIYDDLYTESHVTYVEPYIISYSEYDGYCRSAVIDNATRTAMFPVQYELYIVKGTKVKYYCNKIYSFKHNGKWADIDW